METGALGPRRYLLTWCAGAAGRRSVEGAPLCSPSRALSQPPPPPPPPPLALAAAAAAVGVSGAAAAAAGLFLSGYVKVT